MPSREWLRRGFGYYRGLQPDPDPDIERARRELLAERRKQRPYFIGFMVVWLGGLLLITNVR